MHILITGGTGYIGSHTAISIAQAGHKVVLFDNLQNSRKDVCKTLETITGIEIPFIHGDVRDTELLINTLKEHQIDAVTHFAGLKAVGESAENPIDYYSNNIAGTISLLQAMQETAVKTLVFSSSATVYGDPQYLPLDESHPTIATNPYGRTKLHIEEILADVAQSDLGWNIACLRYFNPVGAHESGLISENPTGIPNNLMPYIIKVASGELPHLNVFGNNYPTPDGTGIRDYIHVTDLVEGHLAALNFLENNNGAHTINLGTGQGYSVLEMIKTFERSTGCSVPYQIVKRRPGDIASCYANVDNAKTLLNWGASRSLEDMCISSWKSVCL
jgi:UDP-glucose 4-epimerase